jgi:hypothetical protein
MDHSMYTNPPAEGHLGFLQLGAVMDYAVKYIPV